ncbi:unnamed protein product [Lactuca virosa]|uniref:Uncharacterized protein n=1 Tax=Lactuca virosa TaxID=75947 RepID=A0AAU9PUY5_9ASTR|nr:unnamed protein product [Lactuca virosa]
MWRRVGLQTSLNLSKKDSNVVMDEGSSTSAIETTTVPPPPQISIIPPTSVPTISPTFQGVMAEPITMLFSSQSTKPEIDGKYIVSGKEVKFLLKSQESQIRTLIDGNVKGMDEHLATHSRTFHHEIEKLQDGKFF